MKSRRPRTPALPIILAIALTSAASAAPRPDDPPAAESPMVKLLKSGRIPEARQGTIVDMIGKRGTVPDLNYLYQRALAGGFPESTRIKVFESLAEAATTRGLKPDAGCDRLTSLLAPGATAPGEALRAAAIRLAGAWRLESASDALGALARSPMTGAEAREAAIDALAAIGGRVGRSSIETLAGPGSTSAIRLAAVAALTRLDVESAAARAAALIPQAVAEGVDLKPLIAAFLNRQGAGAVLASAIDASRIPPDAAKMALRSVYSFGQSDPKLVAALGRAAGISTEAKPLTGPELEALVSEVNSKGDPARGEAVFRRADLNCMTCHSVSKAGGEIGPDLSAVGQTSPPDYIINSILMPDQSIKEQYHTLVVLTTDGQVYQGIVTDRDGQRIVLKESTGALRVVPVESIEEQRAGGSLMPKGLSNLMTHVEFVDLVRFLSELGRPGPYAIRSTPTIQRWRVLRKVPPALAESVPDAVTLQSQVLSAAPDHWATIYAKVSGALPLDEAAALSDSKVLYVQGEIQVTAQGEIDVHPTYPDAIRYWVDEVAAPAGTREFSTSVTPGRHTVTVRVEFAERSKKQLRIEVGKPMDSKVEFTVVGGK